MDVCLMLLLLPPCLPAFANGIPFSKMTPVSRNVRLPKTNPKGMTLYWNPSAFFKNPEFPATTKGSYNVETGEEEEFEKAVKAISSLEISKSIELVFDPKTQALVPTAEIPMKNQGKQKKAHDSAVVLLSPKTYVKLKKVFDDLEREKKRGESGFKNLKNFQTGRFKSKYFKTIQSKF